MNRRDNMDIVTLALAKQYTDSQRLGYTSVEEGVIIPEMQISDWDGTAHMPSGVDYPVVPLPLSTVLVVDREYTVTIDGVRYVSTALDPDGTGMYITLGNLKEMGMADTGEPFLLMTGIEYVSDNGEPMCEFVYFHDGTDGSKPPSITVSMTGKVETIHPIDPKFIPPVKMRTVLAFENLLYDDGEYVNLNYLAGKILASGGTFSADVHGAKFWETADEYAKGAFLYVPDGGAMYGENIPPLVAAADNGNSLPCNFISCGGSLTAGTYKANLLSFSGSMYIDGLFAKMDFCIQRTGADTGKLYAVATFTSLTVPTSEVTE
jgi:hypothetical protein